LALHGHEYPLKGRINFANNQVDQKTGTIRMKARFDNPKPPTGARVLAAGMYARVRVPIGEPVKAMLVPDSAFGSDQGVRFLFIIGPDNKAIRWNATAEMQEGDMRVVDSIEIPGKEKPRPLSPNDQIITTGIQRVRPNMVVDPKPAAK
jgi:multidrug efflux pump subunit AcrA (membrane-fusion protein)